MINKSKKEIFTKIQYPHFGFFDFIVERDYVFIFEVDYIKQPLHDGRFSHFTPGQDSSTLGFSFFNIFNPL
ncbi:MAG: hypothetical protein MUF15_14530 [Acidobacteria bacterium]|nr:hypothetical protein [Acidobacteriota bacterium]